MRFAYDLLRENGKCQPDHTALVMDGIRYSYRELNELVNQTAYGLYQRGVTKGTKIGFLSGNSVDFVLTVYAAWKLGAWVILFPFRTNGSEFTWLMDISVCDFLIYEEPFAHLANDWKNKNPGQKVQYICFSDMVSIRDNGQITWEASAQLTGEEYALSVFTGGTTGVPKGAVFTYESVMLRTMVYTACEGYTPRVRYLSYLPMYHAGGFYAMVLVFSAGGTLFLMRSLDPTAVLELVAGEKVTHTTFIPPTIVDRFRVEQDKSGLDFSSLEVVGLAGGVTDEVTVRKVFDLLPNATLSVSYSQTEGNCTMFNKFDKKDFEADPGLIDSVGHVYWPAYAKVVDEQGNEVPVGTAGEVWGRCPFMLSKYVGTSEQHFVDGWLPTGDIMKQDEKGNYYFLDRKKHMIKTGGENVYSCEVENAIMKHPSVERCAVVGLPHSELGEQIVAAVVLKEDVAAVTEQELIDHCKIYISSFKKPRKVFFMDAFPTSGVGKLQKNRLVEILKEKMKKGQ